MNIEQKGISSAGQTSASQTGPRYSLLFNIPFFFNIHLYMIWHLMCQFAYYTVFQNLQLKCNSGDEIIKKFSTGFGFFKRSKRKKTFLNILILDIEITLQQFVYICYYKMFLIMVCGHSR